MEPFWEPNGCAPHPVKYESDTAVSGFAYCNENGLNFSTSAAAYSEDDGDFTPGRRSKVSRQDPLSHRIIEKRRRDRMNSCLADLSRLIPPQYQRKGRGRIEKTEIIEMSIRYMKQLQNQEYMQKETAYKLGYEECLQQAAHFLYNGHRDVCFKLVEYLKEHSNDIVKGDYFKIRHNIDSRSASSGSPPAHHSFHPSAPLSQLRDMLTTSDHEHDHDHSNSPDHTTSDIKDLSLRGQPQQAAVITSTAPATHLETTNSQEFDSGRPSPDHHHIQLDNFHANDNTLRNIRMRKLSDPFHDNDHHSYKFKNYFKERFSQDSHFDDISAGTNDGCNNNNNAVPTIISNGCSNNNKSPIDDRDNSDKKSKMCIDYMASGENSCDEKPSTNGIGELRPEITSFPLFSKPINTNNSIANGHHTNSPVPIFALHAQGRYYVPLTVDYDCLVPYLGSIDLFEKHPPLLTAAPPLHAININVNFTHSRAAAANNNNGTTTTASKLLSSTILAPPTRHKPENLSNGW